MTMFKYCSRDIRRSFLKNILRKIKEKLAAKRTVWYFKRVAVAIS